jgi:hypothetical protein
MIIEGIGARQAIKGASVQNARTDVADDVWNKAIMLEF